MRRLMRLAFSRFGSALNMAFANNAAPPATTKECGTCSLCCKLVTVAELEKPSGTWCTHCSPGKGCGIHAVRPNACRSWNCLWLLSPELGPQWKPDKSRMVLMADGRTRRVFVRCDPGFPKAWRKEPYYGQIRQWASQAGPQGGEVFIGVGHDITILANGRELHVGAVAEQDGFATEYDASGRLLRCRVVPPGSPANQPLAS